MTVTINLANESETLALGAKLAQLCPTPCIIYLQGELGAGKTTLVRGFLQSLGYRQTIKSPTYTLVESYEINDQTIFHFDLYRLRSSEEINDIAIRDYLKIPAIMLIEWPEKGSGYLPGPDLILHLQAQGLGRQLQITTNSATGKKLLQQLGA